MQTQRIIKKQIIQLKQSLNLNSKYKSIINRLIVNSQLSNSTSTSPTQPTSSALNTNTQMQEETELLKMILTSTDISVFFAFIKSSAITGNITKIALTSIELILCSIKPEDLQVELLENIIESVVNCKFEATDIQSDEVVLYKIIQVLVAVFERASIVPVRNEKKWDVFETISSMCFQFRLSELLRRYALDSLFLITNIIVVVEKNAFLIDRMLDFCLKLIMQQNTSTESQLSVVISLLGHLFFYSPDSLSLQAHRELFNFSKVYRITEHLLNLLVSNNTGNTRLVSLINLLNSIFEVYLFRELSCEFEFYLSFILQFNISLPSALNGNNSPTSSGSNNGTLGPGSRDSYSIALDILNRFIVQNDNLLLSYLMIPISNSKLIITYDSLNYILSSKNFLLNLFLHYDCNVNKADLLAMLVLFCCKSILQGKGFLKQINLLSSNSIDDVSNSFLTEDERICFLSIDLLSHFIALLMPVYSVTHPVNNTPFLNQVLQKRERKAYLNKAVSLFNNSFVKDCLSYLSQQGIISDKPSPEEEAKILFQLIGLNKKRLGEYLGKPQKIDVLAKFVQQINFWTSETSILRIDEALRLMLEKFRLPGEAQQIERVVQAFSDHFFAAVIRIKELRASNVNSESSGEEDTFFNNTNVDAILVLSYSIVMLNTDLHNPRLKKRMTKDDFIKNLRGTNNGQDFHKGYLSDIYDEIKSREIILPEEHGLKTGFSHMTIVEDNYDFDPETHREDVYLLEKEIFSEFWRIIGSTILFCFWNEQDQLLLQKSISVFYQLCCLAHHFEMSDVFDDLTSAIFKYSHDSIEMISNSFVRNFARNFKQQLSVLIGFRVLHEFPSMTLKKTWEYVFDLVYSFFCNDLLSVDLSVTVGTDFRKVRVSKLVVYSVGNPSGVQGHNRNSASSQNSMYNNATTQKGAASLFSALSNFLLATPDFGSTVTEIEQLQSPTNGEEIFEDYEAKEFQPNSENIEQKSCLDVVKELGLKALFLEKSKHLSDEGFDNMRDQILEIIFAIIRAEIDIKSNDTIMSFEIFVEEQKKRYHKAIFALELYFKILGSNSEARQKAMLDLIIEKIIYNYDKLTFGFVKRIITNIFNLIRVSESEGHQYVVEALKKCLDITSKVPVLKNDDDGEDLIVDKRTSILKPKYASYHVCCISAVAHGFYTISQEKNNFSSILFNNYCSYTIKTILELNETKDGKLVALYLIDSRQVDLIEGLTKLFLVTDTLVKKNYELGASQEMFNSLLELLSVVLNSCASLMVQFGGPEAGENVTASSIAAKLSSATTGSTYGHGISQKVSTPSNSYIDLMHSKAKMCLDLTYQLTVAIPSNESENSDYWLQFWLPVLTILTKACYHPSREIRQQAITFLQRTLLQPEFLDDFEKYEKIFRNVLFPLLEDLVSKEAVDGGLLYLEEIRSRASILLKNLFLRYVPHLVEKLDSSIVDSIWGGILDILKKYYQYGVNSRKNNVSVESDLADSTYEIIKSMVLVINDYGYFGNLQDTNTLWKITWEKLDFLPAIKNELFPE